MRETISAVEGRSEDLAFLMEMLREQGYTGQGAKGPADAIPAVERKTEFPDLLITVAVMPGLEGAQLAAECGSTGQD